MLDHFEANFEQVCKTHQFILGLCWDHVENALELVGNIFKRFVDHDFIKLGQLLGQVSIFLENSASFWYHSGIMVDRLNIVFLQF